MEDKCISSIHIQKLGHKIPEIRERALQNIISKLDHGFRYDNDLSRSKEILQKLLDWFRFNTITCEEAVLKLIKRVLQTESGYMLINHYGKETLRSEILKIRSIVNSIYHNLIEGIISCIAEQKVPPLQSSVPLSYRSDATPAHRSVESTATPFEVFVNGSSSVDQQAGVSNRSPLNNIDLSESDERPSSHIHPSCLVSYTLPWQPLISPDRHVLESIENSLRNPPEPSTLLHSCEFFNDVLLQDFPAEVFLQRPAILTLLQEHLKSCTSTRITNAVIISLLKLTKCIHTRIHYYNDPNMFTTKQIVCANTSAHSSPLINSDRAYEINGNMKSPSSSESSDVENTNVLITKQVPLPFYCITTALIVLEYLQGNTCNLRENSLKFVRKQSCVNEAITLLEKLVSLLSLCVTKQLWEDNINTEVLQIRTDLLELLLKFGDVLDFFRLELISNDSDPISASFDLRMINVSIELFRKLIPIEKTTVIFPSNLKNALGNVLLNPVLNTLYPHLHDSVLKYVEAFSTITDAVALEKYKKLSSVCKSMSCAIQFLKQKNCSTVDSITLAKQALLSLEFHKDVTFVKLFIDLCASRLPSHMNDENMVDTATDVLLSLLAHNLMHIRQEAYKVCHQKVIEAIGPKLNTLRIGAPGSQILFLLQHKILAEIAEHGLCSENTQIQEWSETILLHILKCKVLVTDDVWNKVIEALIPSLPIFLCHVNGIASLGRTLLGILDPDMAKSLYLCTLQVVKGNVEILFCADAQARDEAVSRLCWVLASQDNAAKLLPRLNNLHDKMLASACQVLRPIDLNRNRNTQHFYQPSNLHQVLDLLNSPNVEPVIRRSALTQVSVMMEDHLLHPVFLKKGGVETVLNVMRNALTDQDFRDYPDSVIPAVSILKNICLHNCTTRQELSNNLEFYCFVLRGMFLFLTEERLKEDASTLLFILIFTDMLNGSPSNGNLSLPSLVFKKLNAPFSCNVHNKISKYRKEEFADTLLSDKACLCSFQIHWNVKWCGSVSEVLKANAKDFHKYNHFNEKLKLSNHSLNLLKNYSLEFCVKQCLKEVQNSTTHLNAIEAINQLTSFVQLYDSVKVNHSCKLESFLSLPWESTFSKFLRIVPSEEEDNMLLICALRFLSLLVPLYKNCERQCWITAHLKDASNCSIDLLENDSNPQPQLKTVIQEYLRLVIVCSSQEQHYFNYNLFAQNDKAVLAEWSNVIEVISDSLKFNGTQHFYNLAYLDCLLGTLMHLTSSFSWSKCKGGMTPKEPLPQLISGLCELVQTFHCGKGTAAAMSLMGLSIAKNIMLILNHLVAEMQHCKTKDWELCFFDIDDCETAFGILYQLWNTRDIVLKAAVLQLFAAVCIKPRAALEIVKETGKFSSGIWRNSLNILLDGEEPSIVRENAALILANLCSHLTNSDTDKLFITGKVDSSYIKINDAIEMVRNLLDNHNFYAELENVLSNLYCKSVLNPFISKTDNANENTENSESYLYISPHGRMCSVSSRDSKGSNNGTIVSTPGLVRAICTFLNNILIFDGVHVAHSLQDQSLIKPLFRCLQLPSLKIKDTKDMALYRDILEMNMSICVLLNRIIIVNSAAALTLLHTRDSLNLMLSLVNVNFYYTCLPELVYLRNKLWCEIFKLVITLIDVDSDGCSSVDSGIPQSFSTISECLNLTGKQHFIQAVCEAINLNNSEELQQCALSSLTSLLKVETSHNLSDDRFASISMQNMLDSFRTPRNTITDDIESDRSTIRKNNTETNIIEELYFGKINDIPENSPQDNTDNLMAGAEICKILLHLYDLSVLSNTTINSKKRFNIINTLTATLCVSKEAKNYALQNGLLEILIKQLKEIHVKLSLESVECLRKASDKKRVCPLLKELDALVGLMTNFILGDAKVKSASSYLGLSDLIHKLWLWFGVQKLYLVNILKLLCTYTTDCPIAAQSLTMTSAMAGSGPKKSPSNMSLVHAVIQTITKEMEQISRTHDLLVLQLCFQILHNCCEVTECRLLLVKSNLLNCVSRLHPAISKHQKPWESVELIWLEFLHTFTSYPEGQALVAKTSDLMELVMVLTSSSKLLNRQTALAVLRNIAFHQPNKLRLLNSSDFLNILQVKLTNGNSEEVNCIVAIMWALAANNQKGKLTLKCARLDEKLHEIIKKCRLLPESDFTSQDIDRMFLVLHVLRDNERN